MEEFREEQLVLLWPFALPRTKKLELHTLFRTNDPQTKENLAKTSAARDELILALDGGSASAVMQAAERYLPFLFGLVVAVEDNPNLRLNAPLSFAWSSAFDKDKKPHYYTCYTYRYEACMACLAYAFANFNKAAEVIVAATDASLEEDAKRAAQLLRTAAGIFEYVSTKELVRWLDQPKEKPLEIVAEVCQVLQEYACAAAQCVTLKKALTSGGTSRLVMAKLALDVWKKNQHFAKVLRALPNFKDLGPHFKSFLVLLEGFSKGTAYKYLGQNAHEQEKFGLAVSYLNAASKSLTGLTAPTPGAPLSRYAGIIEKAKDDIEHVKRSFTNENNHIYYQPLVEENALEIPEPKCLMTPLPWVPPQPAYNQLV